MGKLKELWADFRCWASYQGHAFSNPHCQHRFTFTAQSIYNCDCKAPAHGKATHYKHCASLRNKLLREVSK